MIQFSPENRSAGLRGRDGILLAMVLLAAAAIRLYALSRTQVINPDGTIYIQQAKAVASGNWRAGLKAFSYLANYSLLISLFHLVIPGWLTAARAVSLTFGTLALVPLHGLLRQFFAAEEALATTAVLAFLPTWVCNSVDVVRDPVAWFFALYGLYWLAKGIKEQNNMLLPLACLAFLLAAWARIEWLIYLVAFPLLPLVSRRHRGATTIWFYLPVLVGLVGLTLAPRFNDAKIILSASRLQECLQTVRNGVPQYAELRKQILALRSPTQGDLLFFFLIEARKTVWLIALGTIANRLFEAMSYPFTLIALAGLGGFLRHDQDRHRRLFFGLLCASALVLLYLRVLQTWIIEYRYMMLCILPASLLLCAGLGALTSEIGRRLNTERRTPLLLALVVLLVLSTMPKNLEDKRWGSETGLMEIGQFLAKQQPRDRTISLAASSHTIRLIHFYANQYRPGAPFPDVQKNTYPALVGNSEAELVDNLRKRKITYLVWEENNRPKGWPLTLEGGLREMGRWHNEQAGTIILYRVGETE